MKLADTRVPLAGALWLQAWLALPWLAAELPLPGPFASHFVWSKVWAVVLVPAAISLIALAFDLSLSRPWVSAVILLGGVCWSTAYLWHNLPPPIMPSVIERWTAAGLTVASLTRLVKAVQSDALPALEIGVGVVLLLTFASQAKVALGAALSLAGATLFLTRIKRAG